MPRPIIFRDSGAFPVIGVLSLHGSTVTLLQSAESGVEPDGAAYETARATGPLDIDS